MSNISFIPIYLVTTEVSLDACIKIWQKVADHDYTLGYPCVHKSKDLFVFNAWLNYFGARYMIFSLAQDSPHDHAYKSMQSK